MGESLYVYKHFLVALLGFFGDKTQKENRYKVLWDKTQKQYHASLNQRVNRILYMYI